MNLNRNAILSIVKPPYQSFPAVTFHKRKTKSNNLLFGVHEGIQAYWISPDGNIIAIRTTHIDAVHSDYAYFGINPNSVLSLHNYLNEKIGQEGIARTTIIKELINRGFTHIRLNTKLDIWKINCWVLNTRTKRNLNSWIKEMRNAKIADTLTELLLHSLSDNISYTS